MKQSGLLPVLDESIDEIKRISGGSSDLLINRFVTGGVHCALLCCEGMVSTSVITEMIFEPVTDIPQQDSASELFHYISEELLLSTDRPEVTDYDELFRYVDSGFAVLIAEGMEKGLAFGVQGYSSRGVQEPSGEGNIMGAHEGFTETVRTNMSQIRRRLKSPELVMELMVKGEKSFTDICLCYMKDRVPKKLMAQIRSSLEDIRLEAILSTGHIRPFVENSSFEVFSSTGITERPDVLCSKLIEGRVAVLVDGVPYAIVIPRLFCESFQTLDDYAFKPYYATFIRWLKYLAFIIAVLLPSFYVAIVMYHPELLNSTLFMLLVEAEKKAPLSIVTEAMFVLLMYEVIREAGVRLPKPVGGAVSIISGLIIGDAAVNSGLVSTPLLTMTALSVLGGLVVPDLNPQVTILRFAFVIAGGMLGLFGISLLACAVLVNICATEDYGFPYTAPLSPFRRKGMSDTAVRCGIKKLQDRGFTVEEYHE
ncbi:MAG: spore germination protein [Ruminococcus sp.]|uniref:spore germination protein n=1 Tax=Ruminococcus sp. TaxID=41978 RepID=UPI0025F18F97|nr:spore germination protein [Ruminococcus sp.]MCR5601753.1 spore germination protein [Ruminococcus sp.]